LPKMCLEIFSLFFWQWRWFRCDLDFVMQPPKALEQFIVIMCFMQNG
jgi:hypothetical protein